MHFQGGAQESLEFKCDKAQLDEMFDQMKIDYPANAQAKIYFHHQTTIDGEEFNPYSSANLLQRNIRFMSKYLQEKDFKNIELAPGGYDVCVNNKGELEDLARKNMIRDFFQR